MSNILTLPGPGQRRGLLPAPDRLLAIFADDRHGPEDARWLKENAEVLRLLVATGQGVDPDVLHRVHGATARGLPARLAFFPQYYRFFLSIALDLQALGLDGVDARGLVAAALADGLPESELSDLQRAEARLFAERAGVAHRADPGLTDRLLRFGARAATFALPNKKAAYELTHIVFYLTDYGRHTFEGAESLRESLEFAGLVAWLEQNTDLLAEICLALRWIGAVPPAAWQETVARNLAGFQIAPMQPVAAHDEYHCWLMATWAVSAAGDRPLSRGLPQEGAGFLAPRPGASALQEVSAALYDLGPARAADWPAMRPALARRLSPPALAVLDRAAASTPAFEAFFARFARALPLGWAA